MPVSLGLFNRFVTPVCWFLPALLAVLPAAAPAEDAVQEPARDAPTIQSLDDAESLSVPDVLQTPWPGAADLLLILRHLPPVDAEDKGSTYTDAGLGRSAGPRSAREQTKLDLARAAVLAAREAGTLYQMPHLEDAPILTEADAAAAKLHSLLTQQPTTGVVDPAAGIGVSLPSVQGSGPAGLTPDELAKLSGTSSGEETETEQEAGKEDR